MFLESIDSLSHLDKIIILGKGKNLITDLEKNAGDAIKIGLNDTELFTNTDINIIKDQWAAEALKERSQAKLNICFPEITTKLINQYYLKEIVSVGPNCANAIGAVMNKDNLSIRGYDYNFVNAILLAQNIENYFGKKYVLKFCGFNFEPDNSLVSEVQKSTLLDDIILTSQKELFLIIQSLIDPTDTKKTSRLIDHQPELEPSNADTNLKLIAEITTNHFGDRDRLEKMIRLSALQGATHVKLQRRNVDTFYEKDELSRLYPSPFGKTFGDYRRGLELTDEDFEFVSDLSDRLNIEWFISALDEYGLQTALKFERKLVKLPSTISKRRAFLSRAAELYGGAVVISTGMTDREYEHWILNTFTNNEAIYLLQCNSAYPTPFYHTNISVVGHYHNLSKKFHKVIPGYSSHDNGNLGCQLAVACGAKMLEKHVKLGNTSWAHFDNVALDLSENEFGKFTSDVLMAEAMLGSNEKKVTASEHHKYK